MHTTNYTRSSVWANMDIAKATDLHPIRWTRMARNFSLGNVAEAFWTYSLRCLSHSVLTAIFQVNLD